MDGAFLLSHNATQTLRKDGLANVRGEQVDGIVNWRRGQESLELLEPRHTSLAIIGLGMPHSSPF